MQLCIYRQRHKIVPTTVTYYLCVRPVYPIEYSLRVFVTVFCNITINCTLINYEYPIESVVKHPWCKTIDLWCNASRLLKQLLLNYAKYLEVKYAAGHYLVYKKSSCNVHQHSDIYYIQTVAVSFVYKSSEYNM